MNTKANRAVQVLSHYIRNIYEKSGLRWDSDNDAEIYDIIDNIMDAVQETATEIVDGKIEAHLSFLHEE